MAWDLITWMLFFFFNLALLASTLYQIISLSDLEADYINPYEFSSCINVIIVPEFILQGVYSSIRLLYTCSYTSKLLTREFLVYSSLLLLTGHWILFLLSVPINYYNITLYMKQKHIIDVTEVFRILNGEKKLRLIKFGFYLTFLCIIMIRLILSVFNSLADEEDVVHLF